MTRLPAVGRIRGMYLLNVLRDIEQQTGADKRAQTVPHDPCL
ncbi:MAG TPA: hypothetical protein VH302_12065 [Bryobacteraceae bacterium]|nr:hypothetical protein [Bryobacteraceae bacterium]